jgi:hypothetical protein
MRIAGLAAFFLIVSIAQAATAQNLVANGDFATDLAGWDDVDVETWQAADVAADPLSGSVLVPNASTGNTGAYVRQCIAVTAGETYTFGASHYGTGIEAAGKSRVDLRFWSSPTCTSGDLTLHRIESADADAWRALEGVGTAPVNAVAASVSLVAFKTSGPLYAPWFVAFDEAFLVVPEPGALAGGAGALVALVALAGMARRS